MYDVTVIGAAILDVLARPVSEKKLNVRSYPAENVSLSIGGDAANEAVVLSELGKKAHLITKLGDDMAGKMIRTYLEGMGVAMEDAVTDPEIDTGINVVLVDEEAERSFITSRNGSLRKLGPADISQEAIGKSPIVSFASIFVSPLFDAPAMASLFRSVKEKGSVLCADMTGCKNGENLDDIHDAIKYLDYIFPNYEEAALVTGLSDIDEIADAFLEHGTGCVVIKTGKEGCFLKSASERIRIPAWPHTRCIDTTGAGDTFAAGFLYALSEGESPEECARYANAAASVSVEHIGAGAGIICPEQISERIMR